ncbi:MAG: SDR family NAD(P)-dependent oxidoreductase, partial [Nocardioides sp.]
VVTGGGTGIGLGIAEAFCKAGAKVCIAGRRTDVLEQALSSLKNCGDATYGILDVADRSATERFFREREAEGPVEILVMCAGMNIKKRSMTEMDPAEWDRVMAINATGPYNCLHAVLPPMLERAVDQGGCFEDTRATTHSDPTYQVHQSTFYCVANMPGAVPTTSTYALTNATLPYVVALANKGWRQALADDAALAKGLNTHDGTLTNVPVGQAVGIDAVDPATVLA